MDPLADFQITIRDGRKRMVVQVVVHPTVPEMRKAAQMQYNNFPGHTEQDADRLAEAVGVCHRFHMADSPIYAVVRLALPHIGGGVVAHELAHAAIWLWEIQHMWDKRKPLVSSNDEWFCWVLGELVSYTYNKLHEHGLYTT